MTKKLVLIDGHALVHRAFHALPPTLSSPKGVPTNAVFGFMSVLLKMIKDLKPDYIAAAFDLAAPTFRHEEFAEYKAHREKAPDELYAQVPIIKEILMAFGVPIYEKPGFEADDLIGALAEKSKNNPPAGGIQTVIMTGDLDTLQLVDGDKVVVFTLRKGVTDTVIYNESEVVKRYGLKPEQLNDFRGLKGDPSDNIPGVPGVGEKTASELIKKFGNLERLYQFLEDRTLKIKIQDKGKEAISFEKPLTIKLVQKLLENKDTAFFSKKLSTIIRSVDLDFNLDKADWANNLNQTEITRIFKELGLYNLLKRFEEMEGISQPPLELSDKESITGEYSGAKEIKNIKEIADALEELKKNKEMVFDIKDNFFNVMAGKECLNISWPVLLENKLLFTGFKEVIQDNKMLKTTHDSKEIAKFLLSFGLEMGGFYFDTKLAAYLINSDRKDYSLEKIYFDEFQENMDSNSKKYPIYILKLKEKLSGRLKKENLDWLFENIEIPTSKVLAEMELRGVLIDTKAIARLSKTIAKQILDLEKKIYALAGGTFNINSPQQLSAILFDPPPSGLGLKGKTGPSSSRLRRTSKGALSTAASELEKLASEHPVIDLILKYRELQKIRTTYVEPFPGLINKTTGRIHTTFNQTGTATGRLASQDPNLQNIPIKTELGQEFRKVFVASPGFKLISFDYSQIELRVAAHISQDTKMTEAFKRGEDIHTRTAAEIFGVKPEQVDKNMRRDAKVMNFGILYGMGILGFQRASGVSRERAREFIDKYLKEFSGIARYMNEIKIKAHKNGYVSTLFGRRRWLPEIKSSMPQVVSQAERMAINHPIQGTATGDLMKLAMIKVFDYIHESESQDNAFLLLQVHDELLFEIKENLVEKLSKKLKDIMENIYKLDVPLTVEVKYGNNWAEMQEI